MRGIKQVTLFICIVMVVMYLLTACSSTSNTSIDLEPSKDTEITLETDDQLDDTLKSSINSFAYLFYEQFDHEENLFFSPFSITEAVAMLDNAAAGETKAQIDQLFGMDDLDQMNRQLKLYQDQEQADEEKLSIANSVWISKNMEVAGTAKDFLNRLVFYYNGEVRQVDFREDNEQVIQEVNEWVADQTDGMIDPFTEYISPDAVLALYNAIYFYGEWSNAFIADKTSKQEFQGTQTTSEVDMMHQSNEFYAYTNSNGIKAIQLPYGEGDIAMDIFLPEEEEQSISTLFLGLSTETKEELLESLNQAEPEEFQTIAIPKFTIDYTVEDMNDIMKDLGMIDAFNENADFSILGDGLYVSEIAHKAKIEVDEEGSRASGVTGITVDLTSVEEPMEDPLEFIADQPFIFVIQDTNTGVILFIGEVNQL